MSSVRTVAAALALVVSSLTGVAVAQQPTQAARSAAEPRSLVWVCQTPTERGEIMTVSFHENGVMTMVMFDSATKQKTGSGVFRYTVENNNILRVFDQSGKEILRVRVVYVNETTMRLVEANGTSTTWEAIN
jgi:hypothetical protein